MCKGFEEYTKIIKIIAIIDYLKMKNIPTKEIISEISAMYNVTESFVKSIMETDHI